MDPPVNQRPAAVLSGVAAPARGVERKLLLQLRQPQRSQRPAIQQLFGRPHRGHKAVVFRYHQRHPRIGGEVDDGLRLCRIPRQRLLHQDMLACRRRQPGVGQVQVVRRTYIYRSHLRGGDRAFVRAETPRAPELGGIFRRPPPIAAGEIQCYVPQLPRHFPGECPGEGPAPDYAQPEFHNPSTSSG